MKCNFFPGPRFLLDCRGFVTFVYVALCSDRTCILIRLVAFTRYLVNLIIGLKNTTFATCTHLLRSKIAVVKFFKGYL